MPKDDFDSKRLAVLIDGENMPAKFAETIFNEVAKYGDASVRRLYGDLEQGSMAPWKQKLALFAIKPMVQPQSTVGKNSSDIAMVIDAMDLLGTGRFDGFVLVSSDSDFTGLAIRLREESAVWGMGEKKTPDAFRMACKQFITVDHAVSSGDGTTNSQKSTDITADLNQAYQRISNVVSQTNDPDGWAGLAWLGHQVLQRYPDFDPRSYGEKRLRDLILKIDRFEIDESGPDFRLRPRT